MNDEATEKQIRFIWSLEKQLGREPKWHQGITKNQAKVIIENLQETLETQQMTGQSHE